MSRWCPSSSVCGMAVVCAAAVPSSAVVWLVSYSSHCSAGEYCCHVVFCSIAGCVVCGWCVCVSVLFVWWGIFCPLPPRRGGGWGHSGWWVAWLGEGAAVLPASPSCVWCPPCRLPCGPIEWREWCVLCYPVFGLGLAPCIVPSLSHCLFPSYRSCPSFVLCCRVCCGWGSAVGCCVSLPSSVFVSAVTALLV